MSLGNEIKDSKNAKTVTLVDWNSTESPKKYF